MSHSPKTPSHQHYSRRVHLMRRVLPIAGGIGILILLLWTTLSTFFERKIDNIPAVSQTQITKNTVVNPRLKAADSQGTPFTLEAESATHSKNSETDVQKPHGTIKQSNGHTIDIHALKGQLNADQSAFIYEDNVTLTTSDGFTFTTQKARVNLQNQSVDAQTPLHGQGPIGTLLSEGGFHADKNEETLLFRGPSTLKLHPANAAPTDVPLEILSPSGIICHQAKGLCTATGPITATREDLRLTSERLVLVLSKANDSGNSIEQIRAEGKVVLTSFEKGIRATGHTATLTPKDETIVLAGSPTLQDQNTTIKGTGTFTFHNLQNRATTQGRTTCIHGEQILQADHATLIFNRDDKGTLTLDHVQVSGNVVLSTKTELSKANRGNFNVKTEVAELFEDVTLTRKEGQLQGNYARYDMKTGLGQLMNVPGTNTPSSNNTINSQRIQGILAPISKTP